MGRPVPGPPAELAETRLPAARQSASTGHQSQRRGPTPAPVDTAHPEAELIEQLHQQLIPPAAPPPISWWPPAPGWWVLALSLLLLLLLLPWLRRQGRRRRRRRVQPHMSLFSSIPPGLSDSHWLAEVNTRIKQLLKQRGEDSRSEEHTSELQSRPHLVCRLLL